jgi:two-component system, cell cycle sensor histidine kinase and response regulator CckA
MPNRTVTILLVEDDDQLRAMLKAGLSFAGYRVLDARLNSHAAKQVAEYHGPIHIMISDMMMPGTTGYELAKRIRAWRPDMKVLFISGYPKEVLCEDGLLDNGVRFLQKPFDGHVLLAMIAEILHDNCREPSCERAHELLRQLSVAEEALHKIAGTLRT